MKHLRSAIIGGLGLLLSPSAIAEDTGTQPEAKPSIITSVIDRTFQRDVIEYGDAVVLFYSSAPSSEERRVKMRNLEDGFYQVAEISQGLEREGKAIKFVKYDIMQLSILGLSSEEAFAKIYEDYDLTGFPSIVIYKEGVPIDRYNCMPNNAEAINPMVFNMSQGWLPSRFVGPLDGELFGYAGSCKIHAIDEE
jgi:hypothetical protein